MDDGERLLWQFAWGVHSRTTITERLWRSPINEPPGLLFDYSSKNGLKTEEGSELRGLIATGSVMSLMNIDALTRSADQVRSLRAWAAGITSLELLSPVAMRGNDRGTSHGIGTRGQRLAGFLAALDSRRKSQIVERLRDFYPLQELNTTKKRAGWIDLRIQEAYNIGAIPANHVSDGFLRLLALCAVPEFSNQPSMVLLDEIEDGIEPHVLPRVIERVVKDSSAQFIMTSHSPLLINFFSADDISLVARTQEGRSCFTPLTKISAIQQGMQYQGPGEIWANSGLQTLEQQARSVSSSLGELGAAQNKFADEWATRYLAAT